MAKKSAKTADIGRNGNNGFSSSADTAQKPVNGAKTNGVFDVGKTDYTKWRLLDEAGRQTWHYLTDEQAKEWPQSFADKYFLNMRPLDAQELPTPKNPLDSVKNGLEFFKKLQLPPGNWASEYGGPLFLGVGLIVAWHVTEHKLPEAHRIEMINYLFARANKDDGGWGLHVEADSTVFGTSMNYVCLRLLGVPAEDPRIVKARNTLHRLGGAENSPHWAKFWLAVLGVASWDIVNPIPPELFLLPHGLFFHPWRWWIHIRAVAISTSYIWSKRWVAPVTPVIKELRQEMFAEPYETISWEGHRNTIAVTDNFHPKTWVLNLANFLIVYMWMPLFRTNWIKRKAEEYVWHQIEMEDANTDYSDLAVVNAPMNTIACLIHDGPGSYSVKRHIDRLEDYLWVKDEGMLMNGTNGVQIWDTAFAIQMVMEAGLAEDPKYKDMLMRALEFLEDQQIRENVPHQEECYRQRRKGGWAFSNKDQGYAVSDCIAEALKAVILLQRTPGFPTLLDDQRIYDAIDTLLTFQNKGGGCASYELQRGPELLEWLNAAEVFGRIMVEYNYPECTTACVTALSLFHKHYPNYRADEINYAKNRMVTWIKSNQAKDGSWYGSWGICFTYATMFALEALESIGETYTTSSNSKRGCDFLISHQRADGGWSESYKACETGVYTEHPDGSLVVQTAWALLGLMYAEYPDLEPIRRGVEFLMKRQQPNGEWLQESIEGVFNKSAMITYQNYKFVFPMMALGRYYRLLEGKKKAR